MNQPIKAQPQKTAVSMKRYSSLSTIIKSLFATVALAGIIGSSIYLISGSGIWASPQSGDVLDQAQIAERQKAFAMQGAISLSLVPETSVIAAVDSMSLPLSSRDALLSNLKQTPSVSSDTQVPPSVPAQENAVRANAAIKATAKAPAEHKDSPLRLAWVTLWDTDTEDGDVVRLDSKGYSRTITLTKQPVTFAIPVPSDGVINVSGIRDGEGGGITVGLASGESRAVFPIMSVGQTLGLKVRVR